MVADGGAGRRRTEPAVSEDLTPGAMPGSLPFDHDAIRRLLDDRTAQRGAAYQRQGRVRDLVIADNGRQINGLVRGTRAKPYRVKVAVNGSGKTLWVMGSCSCPVSFDCKHIAAVLYEALGRPSGAPLTVRPSAAPTLPPPDPLAGPLGYWLKAVSAALPVSVGGEAAERVIYLLNTQTGDTRATLQIGIASGPAAQSRRLRAATQIRHRYPGHLDRGVRAARGHDHRAVAAERQSCGRSRPPCPMIRT